MQRRYRSGSPVRVRTMSSAATSRASLLAFAAVILAIVGAGVWIALNRDPGMLWFYTVAVTATLMLFVGYPFAAARGHATEGAVAVFLAIAFGPLSLIVSGPWLRSLASRFGTDPTD